MNHTYINVNDDNIIDNTSKEQIERSRKSYFLGNDHVHADEGGVRTSLCWCSFHTSAAMSSLITSSLSDSYKKLKGGS